MIRLNDLSRWQDLENVIPQALTDIVKSGNYILGPQSRNFERELANYLGVKFAAGVASGTDALRISLLASGVRAGDKVATVANAGAYSTTAILGIGAKPIFVDCDANAQMSPSDLSKVLELEGDIKAVIATHLYGLIGEIEEIARLCTKEKAILIEDCAQAIGATKFGTKAGAFGDIATFSFYPTKNLGALGDAGAIVTNSSNIIDRVFALRQYGWHERYVIREPNGGNSRLDEIQAAILNLRLSLLDELNLRRKEIWRSYKQALAKEQNLKILGSTGGEFVAHLGILLAKGKSRETIKSHLESNGVECGIHYPNLDYQQPGLAFDSARMCPQAESLVTQIVTIPLHPYLFDHEVDQITRVLESLENDA